jgi:hypothetical protein
MKAILISAATLALTITVAVAQDTARTTVRQGDPELRQSSEEMQRNTLEGMTKISASDLPEKVKTAINSAGFKGGKSFYQNKKKDEFVVEVKDGEITSYHFFDKNGRPRNKQ